MQFLFSAEDKLYKKVKTLSNITQEETNLKIKSLIEESEVNLK